MNEKLARETLGTDLDNQEQEGRIHRLASTYVSWNPGDSCVQLDGCFSITELEAMVWWTQNWESLKRKETI